MTVKAFVDFYNAHNVIPVGQDLADLDTFLFKRKNLYATLGVPLPFLRGKRVLEFGPGGGFNAIATSRFQPAHYCFVDASGASLEELRKKKARGAFRADSVEIIESDIFAFEGTERFDVVVCEGTIPCQNEPEQMLRHVMQFVAPGGMLIMTTISASSILSEACRRLLKVRIESEYKDFESQIERASLIFDSHLKALDAKTRSTRDWVIDNIVHDYHRGRYIFAIPDALSILEDAFVFYNSSPRFLVDDRWYKKVGPSSPNNNDLVRKQLARMTACLIDYRVPMRPTATAEDAAAVSQVEPLCAQACALHEQILESAGYSQLDEFNRVLREISTALPLEFEPTRAAIGDFVVAIERFAAGSSDVDFGAFESWWGRGQQYVSFLRRD